MNREMMRESTQHEKTQSAIYESRMLVLARMQDLTDLNMRNAELYQELDDRMCDIEEMSEEEREKHLDEYKELEKQVQELKRENNEAHVEFEYLRKEYKRHFM